MFLLEGSCVRGRYKRDGQFQYLKVLKVWELFPMRNGVRKTRGYSLKCIFYILDIYNFIQLLKSDFILKCFFRLEKFFIFE